MLSLSCRGRISVCVSFILFLGAAVNIWDLWGNDDWPQVRAPQVTAPQVRAQQVRASQVRAQQNDDLVSERLFEDKFFAPLLSLYDKKTKGELSPGRQSFRSGTIPRVLLWSEPFSKDFWEAQLSHIRLGLCPLPCEVIYDIKQRDTVDAIVIYLRGAKNSREVSKSLAPRDPNQPWIMSTFEAPPRANSIHKTNYNDFNGFFNRTMMYRHDADVRVPHGFIVRRGRDANSLPSPWVVPPKDFGNRTLDGGGLKLAVAFISNCQAETKRLDYISKVQNYAPVDVYGKCGTLKCGQSMYVDHKYNPTQDPCLKMAGEKYLFFFAFENSFCVDYVTEKLYNLLYYPIVPVVLGSADYSTLLPPNSYIDASQYSPRELAMKLMHLQSHPREYQKYLSWRQHYQPSTIGGERTLCHLCARLHDPDFYENRVIEDFYEWFLTKSQCRGL